jgi:hypothetical protein
MRKSEPSGKSGAPKGRGGQSAAAWWRSLKASEKVAWLGAITGVAGVAVAAIGLIPSYYDTFVKGDDKSAQPVLSPTQTAESTHTPRSTASATTSAVRIDKIAFPEHDGQSMVAAKPLAKTDVKPLIDRLNGNEPISVLRPLGYTDVVNSMISLHISGGHPTPVRIINMHAVSTCRSSLKGVLIYNPNAGEMATTKIGFDLDEPDPPARESSLDAKGVPQLKGEYFVNHEYVLSADEPADFTIMVTTSKHYCEFHFVMDLLVDGKSVYQNIDNNGKPFTVSAGIGRYDSYHEFVFDFSSYRMFLQSPITTAYPAGKPSWKLGDPRHPPLQG